MNDQSEHSLALVGKDVKLLFDALEQTYEHLSSTSLDFSAASWQYESQRFSLWADNLGLHHRGHSSLDYRLREASALETFVLSLLNDLKKTLKDR